jgi:hydroxyacylglutathione hydrolase
LVDPVDAGVAIRAVRQLNPARVRILVTHGHPDHIAGNDEVVAALGCEVLAPAAAERWPTRHDVGLRDGDRISLGGAEIVVERR